jgi:hypothetical protein
MNPQPLMPRYISGTPWGVRGNIPNAVYRHHTAEIDVEYRINAQGMRADRDIPFEKPPGTCRIALFGDSYFVGYELPLEESFAARLERGLSGESCKTEVLNFAVSGFGTAEMVRTYEEYARRFDPDVVVFEWHGTDVDDSVRSGLYTLHDGQLRAGAREYLPSIQVQDALMAWRLYRLVADHSHLYSWLREAASGRVKQLLVTLASLRSGPTAPRPSSVRTPAVAPSDPATDYASRLTAELLRHARQTAESEGKLFVVVDIPNVITRTRLESTWGALPQEPLAGISIVRGMDVLVPLIDPATKLYFEKGHRHLTAIAADALASATAARIREQAAASSEWKRQRAGCW